MISLLTSIDGISSALNAERLRMDVISRNIANANTTRDVDGKPYQRRQVVFETVLGQQPGMSLDGAEGSPARIPHVEIDHRPASMVHRPGHPDADKNGMVAMPNVSVHEEFADLMAASRSFEANLALVRTARTMALQTMAIGKR